MWTPRSRVEAAITHQEPDRVPTNLTITETPYRRLCEALGHTPSPDLSVSSFKEVQPEPAILRALGVDIVSVKLKRPTGWKPPDPDPDGTSYDEWGVGRKSVELIGGSSLSEVSHSPMADPDLEAIYSYPWPDPDDPGRTAGLEEEVRGLYETSEFAILGRFGGTILEQAAYLRGWEEWLIDLSARPEFARALMERIADIQITLDEIGIRTVGKYLSIFKLSGEDLGMQDRPLFSMEMWRSLVRPVLERRWRAAREALDRHAPHVKLMLHSDGAIRPFIPDLIECGIDILDPIQPRCPGMELEGLKQDFGDELVFHGAIDTQEVLPASSEQGVVEHVRQCIGALGAGGGYILAPVHNVQPDVPPENLIATFSAAREFGRYPIPT